MLPGIRCNLAADGIKKRSTLPNSDCQLVEDSLSPLFLEIQCDGLIEWELINTAFDGNLVSRGLDVR